MTISTLYQVCTLVSILSFSVYMQACMLWVYMYVSYEARQGMGNQDVALQHIYEDSLFLGFNLRLF